VPLFEIAEDESLVPFRQLTGGAELYERELEQLLWDNIDDFTGEALFRVARQPRIGSGGRPDIVALDVSGHAVVIEVKRDVDRSQLAQCLEYAGWARTASLDELAGMYHLGSDRFFRDWQEFTESDVPLVISRPPRLVLVAREFHGRTGSAFEFLAENGLPVGVIEVSLYEDQQGRRFVDVGIEGAEEVDDVVARPARQGRRTQTGLGGRRFRVSDLLDAGLLQSDQTLIWDRPRLGQTYRAKVRDNGAIELEDGRVFSSVSSAACEAAGIPAYDGWYAWRADGVSLHDLRVRLLEQASKESAGVAAEQDIG